MKDELDMIFSDKDSDIEKISSRYKAVDDQRKEKIYEISKRKYNILKAGESEAADDGFIVSAEGVERYSRPKLYRYFSAAAAALVLFGGAFGGVMLSRSSKVQHMSSSSNTGVTEATSEGVTKADIFSDDTVVDKLLSNVELIQRAQYPETNTIDLSDGIWFNSDEFVPEVGKQMSITKYYYAVKDERLDTWKELDAFFTDTFIKASRERYVGPDIGSYDVGYDFKDDPFANKYLLTFILYNDKVYAKSLCEPDKCYAYGFDGLYNFSNYKLVSSEFEKGGSTLIVNGDSIIEDLEVGSLEKLVTCTREYERPDGQRIVANIELLPEDGVWKLASFSVKMKNEEDQNADSSNNELPTVEAPSDDSGFAQLQLHEEKKYYNTAETSSLLAELDNAWNNGTYRFKKVDTEKYAQQIWNAGGFDELNTLENKSFIYHMMWNSYNYFDSADITYNIRGEHGSNVWSDEEHSFADNRGKYYRIESEIDNNLEHGLGTTYLYDGISTSVNENEKTYYEWYYEFFDYLDRYMPDQYRWIKVYDEETGEPVQQNTYHVNVENVYILYPGAGDFYEFDKWYIEGVEEILGRQCAAISYTEGDYSLEMLIDMRTGIVMRYTKDFADIGQIDTMKVTSLVLNEPVEHKYFDKTGYTKERDDTIYNDN